jgi:hypothetical protein
MKGNKHKKNNNNKGNQTPPTQPPPPPSINLPNQDNDPNGANNASKHKRNKWVIINSIANICIALGTLYVGWIATHQNKHAQDSAKAAIKADSVVIKQFEIVNEPYLVTDIPVLKEFKINKPLDLDYEIRNIGNYPIRLNTAAVGLTLRDSTFEKDTVVQNIFFKEINTKGKKKANVIVTKDWPAKRKFYGIMPFEGLTPQHIVEMNKGTLNFYFVGYCSYENLINGKKKIFRFIMKIMSRNGEDVIEYIKNENKFVYPPKK